MHLLLIALLTLLPHFVDSVDNIVLPYERFQHDLEKFIPTVDQEIKFVSLPNVNNAQAYEMIKTFFPILQLRIQEIRSMGVIADDRRRRYKESMDTMCGRGHIFGYLKVDRRLRDILSIVNTKNMDVKNIIAKLTAMQKALNKWSTYSKMPCDLKRG